MILYALLNKYIILFILLRALEREIFLSGVIKCNGVVTARWDHTINNGKFGSDEPIVAEVSLLNMSPKVCHKGHESTIYSNPNLNPSQEFSSPPNESHNFNMIKYYNCPHVCFSMQCTLT